jgi:hypothetical protein
MPTWAAGWSFSRDNTRTASPQSAPSVGNDRRRRFDDGRVDAHPTAQRLPALRREFHDALEDMLEDMLEHITVEQQTVANHRPLVGGRAAVDVQNRRYTWLPVTSHGIVSRRGPPPSMYRTGDTYGCR